ncbi:MAG TPA: sigma-54-dependent Fis family transcriptional regulator, partial [Thermodesulforhabdus norvegica]|nr:sigma-54-dependent Fis family transcriptional regulator [Thermodesulforhabdus norvegica]
MVVDDDPGMLEVLELMLTSRGYRVVAEADGRRAIERVKSEKFDLAVMDIRMRPVDGLAVLKEVKRFSPDTVVIMISAYANAETAVEAMKAGAYDYLPKPFKVEEFMEIIEEALERRRLESSDQEREKHGEGILHFGLLVGESPAMQQVYRLIEKVAQIDSTVLIRGESGTGKELVARAIHRLSARASSPMVVVNCCGVPESLIESELFGYKKGAFTGATRDRCGLVEAANHGTLFLDEVGELSPQLQAKLLRLLQEKTIRPVGGTVDVPVDVRIIAATNRDLEKMVLEGTFREDLYYRLNVIPIHLPPLRERREDIPLLA